LRVTGASPQALAAADGEAAATLAVVLGGGATLCVLGLGVEDVPQAPTMIASAAVAPSGLNHRECDVMVLLLRLANSPR
jgi:hypothetical protein